MSAQEYNHYLSQEAFQQAYRKALNARLWRKITGKPVQTLLPFEPILAETKHQNRFERQVRTVLVTQIVGSLSRWQEFDREFRPLSKNLRNRWTAIADLSQAEGWAPVRVHQIGNLYFVEDGHHRVSVARQFGFPDIEAIVYDHPLSISFDAHDSLKDILQKIALLKRTSDARPCYPLMQSGIFC